MNSFDIVGRIHNIMSTSLAAEYINNKINLLFSGVVPKPSSQVEETQEEHQRFPLPRQSAPLTRATSLWGRSVRPGSLR